MSTGEHIHTNTCIVDISAHIKMETNACFTSRSSGRIRGGKAPPYYHTTPNNQSGVGCAYVLGYRHDLYTPIRGGTPEKEGEMQGHE